MGERPTLFLSTIQSSKGKTMTLIDKIAAAIDEVRTARAMVQEAELKLMGLVNSRSDETESNHENHVEVVPEKTQYKRPSRDRIVENNRGVSSMVEERWYTSGQYAAVASSLMIGRHEGGERKGGSKVVGVWLSRNEILKVRKAIATDNFNRYKGGK